MSNNLSVEDVISKYHSISYKELTLEINENLTYEVIKNGNLYTIESNVFWDDRPGGVVRIAIFANFQKKKWWQADKPIYSALVNSDNSRL